jgi:hypothetical protein
MSGQEFNSDPSMADHSFISSEMGENWARELRFCFDLREMARPFFTQGL